MAEYEEDSSSSSDDDGIVASYLIDKRGSLSATDDFTNSLLSFEAYKESDSDDGVEDVTEATLKKKEKAKVIIDISNSPRKKKKMKEKNERTKTPITKENNSSASVTSAKTSKSLKVKKKMPRIFDSDDESIGLTSERGKLNVNFDNVSPPNSPPKAKTKNPWKDEETDALIDAVEEAGHRSIFGPYPWVDIKRWAGDALKDRTDVQYKDRWKHIEDVGLRRLYARE